MTDNWIPPIEAIADSVTFEEAAETLAVPVDYVRGLVGADDGFMFARDGRIDREELALWKAWDDAYRRLAMYRLTRHGQLIGLYDDVHDPPDTVLDTIETARRDRFDTVEDES